MNDPSGIVPEVILQVHRGDKYMGSLRQSELMTLHKAIQEKKKKKGEN